jgi:outer membrane protein assembly factor BamB
MNARRVSAALAAVSVVALLAACNRDKTAEPPAELVDIRQTLEIRKLWSRGMGGGAEKLQLALGLAEDQGVLYAAARDGVVVAMEPDTGRTRWETKLKEELSAGPAAGGDMVAVAASSGDLIVLEATTGKLRWRKALGGEVLAAPLLAGDRVIIRTVDGRMVALDAADGAEAWTTEDVVPRLSLRGTSPPVRAGDVVVSGFDTGRVMAVTISGGDILWQTQLSTPRGRSELERLADVDAAVQVDGQEVFAVGYQGRVAMIALDSGQLWWARDLSSYRGLALDGEQLYVATSDGDVVALRRRDGNVLWEQTGLKRRWLGPPAVHGGAVVVGDFDGYLHWLDRDTGRFVARQRPGRSRFSAAPVVRGDRLFVIDDGGEVTAFRAGGRPGS